MKPGSPGAFPSISSIKVPNPRLRHSTNAKKIVDTLPAAFTVWAATKEASFLHGRFAWASWDVEELATGKFRERLEKDPYYLRASIVGLKGGLNA